jgi:hypothetical protein
MGIVVFCRHQFFELNELPRRLPVRITKTMKSVLLVFAAVALFSTWPAISAQSATSATPSHPAQVFLTNAQIDPNFPSSIRAFVRTGSLSANCLTTMGDTSFVATGTIVFCAPREPAGLGKGVLVSVFYPQPPSEGLTLTMTLWQQGAKGYGAPVLCTVDGC